MSKVSVITGDIIGSTFIRNDKRKDKLLDLIKECLKDVKKSEKNAIQQSFEIFRGDSFQGIVVDIKKTVAIVLKIKAGLLMRSMQLKNAKLDARISVGIGSAGAAAKIIKESDGIAFHLSGKQLDEMKEKNKRISIVSEDDKLNKHLDLLSTLLELITKRWTFQQAEVMYYLLNNKTQTDIAEILKLAQPSINQRAQLGRKNEIMKAINYFEWLSLSMK